MKSQQTREILQADDFGLDSLTSERLDHMMERSIMDIGQEVDRQTLERIDYLIKEALGNQEIDSALPSIQKKLKADSPLFSFYLWQADSSFSLTCARL